MGRNANLVFFLSCRVKKVDRSRDLLYNQKQQKEECTHGRDF